MDRWMDGSAKTFAPSLSSEYTAHGAGGKELGRAEDRLIWKVCPSSDRPFA